LLTAVGASAIAGCSGLRGLGDDRRETISSHRLPRIDEESAPEPTVQPSVPVDIDRTYLDTARRRTDSLLAELPMPLGPDDVPNGHVRRDLVDAADDATDELDEALAAETRLSALRSLRHARERARYAAAGWAVVEDDLTVDRVRQEYRRSVSDGRSFRERHAYVGTDPTRAVLVHARIEEALATATDDPRVHPSHDSDGLLAVAAWGGEAESTRALVADARHLSTRHRASLPNDVGTIRETFGGAAETLSAAVRSRRSDLQPEPTADEWGATERIVDDLRRAAATGSKRVADGPGPARAVVDATERLASIRGLQWVRSRIEDGERFRIGSAADLRSLRDDAYDELEAALGESPDPDLARTVVTEAAGRVATADWELSRFDGEIRLSRFDDVVRGYVVGTALARATPAACRQTVDALRAA
jgi:hypothetical protein